MILHVIVTALFTKLSRMILRHAIPAVVSGLLFASHPIHTEAVAGVVGRADIGACLFFLLALMSYMEYVKIRDTSHDPGGQSSRFLFMALTGVLTTASMLTKEQGVTVLGVCAAYDLFVHNKMKLQRLMQFYKRVSIQKQHLVYPETHLHICTRYQTSSYVNPYSIHVVTFPTFVTFNFDYHV